MPTFLPLWSESGHREFMIDGVMPLPCPLTISISCHYANRWLTVIDGYKVGREVSESAAF
jgi:hypothetical protein